MRTLDSTTASEIKSQIRSNPIIPDASTQVLCEWNMGNVFFARGFNDFGGGNDLYSTMYGIKERVANRQPMMQSNSFSKPWRETNNIRSLVAVSKNSAAAINAAHKAANSGRAWSLNDYRTYATDSFDGSAFRNWVSPRRSVGTNELGVAGLFPCGGRTLDVKTPRFFPPKRHVTVHGIMKNTVSTNDLFLLTKDKIDTQIFKAGNYLAFDHALGGGPFNDISTVASMQILNAGVRNITEPVAMTAKSGTKVLTFAENTWGLLRTNVPVTIGTFTTKIASWRKRMIGKSRPGRYWVEIILKDPLPSDVKANQNITFTFSFIRVRHYASNRTIVRNYGVQNNIVSMIVGSTATTSQAVNEVLAKCSYTGGGGVKFLNNITLTEPMIIPPNVYLDFSGRTIDYHVSASAPYMAYFGNSRTNVTGVSYNPASPTTLTLSGVPATNIQQSLIAGARMALRVVSIKTVGTIRKVIETPVTFTIDSYTLGASTITIKQHPRYVPQFAGATGVMSLAPNEASAAGNNIIVGGTWNAGGTTSVTRGHFSMSNTHFVWIKGATLNLSSNCHSINIEGCTNIKISGITQTNANHATTHNEAAGVYLTSHNFSDKSDACDNVQIYNSTFNSVYGIRANVDRASVSEKNTNISIKNCTLTGSLVGADLTDCDNTAIQQGTITGTTDNAIQIHADLGSVTNNYIYGVTTAAATSGKSAIVLSGKNSDSAVVRTTIDSNTLTCNSTSKVVLSNTAYIVISNNPAVATTANISGYGNTTTGCSRVYYAAGVLPNTFVITNVEPTTQYIKDRAEVLTVKQIGEKIVITLERPLTDVRVGDYLMLVEVNLGVDGPKKIMRLESTNPKTPWAFDKITLASTISQTLQNPTGTPVELNPDDDIGFACSVQEVPVNKITAKFETSHGTPKTAVVQTKSRGVWTTVYEMPSEADLSDEDEIGDSKVDNIKTLNLYYNGTTWSTTKSYFNPAVNQHIVNADAVRVIVDTTVGDRQFVTVTEISARLVLDATDYVTDFSIDKELGESSKFAPIGRSSTNTGSVSFLNDSRLFDQNNISGPLYQLFKKNAVLHFFVNYTGVATPVKLGTLLVDEWSSDGRDKADAKLVDKSLLLQNNKCQDIFFFNGDINSRKSTSVKDVILTILDSVSFGNYVVYGMDDFEKMKFLWTKKEDNPWEILQDIAEVFQISLYFDEVGRLHIMSKGYLYAPYFVRIGSATTGQNKVTITTSTLYGKADLSKITPGMLVTEINATTGVPRYERIPANTVVMAVGQGTLGNEVLISNNTVGTQGGINLAFGRLTDYDIIGGFVGDRLVPTAELESANNDYNFNVQENVPLPAAAPTGSTVEQYPTCTKLFREPDFYTYSYTNTGTVVTLVLVPAHNDIPAPVNGSALTISGLGSSFDGNVTLTAVTAGVLDGISYTVTYNKSATAVLISSEEIGTAHYTSAGVAGWKAKSLSPSTQYNLSGWIFLPTGQSDVTITAGTTQTVSTKNSWVPIDITFTTGSTEVEKLVTFTPATGLLTDNTYLYNMQVNYSPTDPSNIVEGGYDEVIEASQKKLDSASKIIVKYKNINVFGEGTTGIAGAAQDVGKNAVLWEAPEMLSLGTFDVKEIKNGFFKYDTSGMNEKADPDFENMVIGSSAPIKESGVFEYKDKIYRYAGLEAYAERSLGTGKAYMFIKNEDDRGRLMELNGGLPPKFTGKGQLKKNYPEVFPQVDPNTPPSKVIVAPPAVPVATPGSPPIPSPRPGTSDPIIPGGQGLPLDNIRTQWVFWETGINHDSVGAVINIDKLSKSNRVGLIIYGAPQPNLHSYVIGFQEVNTAPGDRKNTRFVKPFAQRFSTSVTQTKANKPQLDTQASNLKVHFFNENALSDSRVMQDGLTLEVVSYKLDNRLYFDFYVFTQLVATYSDEMHTTTGRKNGGVFFDKGTTGFVQAMYAIKHPATLSRKQWIDPATLIDNQIDQMKKKLQDACNKNREYVRMTQPQKKAYFDKLWMGDTPPCQKAAVKAGNWQWPAYLAALRKQESQVVRRDER